MLEMILYGLIAHGVQHSRLTQHHNVDQARVAIKRLYNDANAAAARGDTVGVFKNCDLDFCGITGKGVRVSLSQMKIHTQNLFAASTFVKASSTILSFTLTGDIAEVVVEEDATIIMHQPGTRETVVLESKETDRDTWVKKKGAWKEQEAKIETISQQINGKPVPK